MSTKKINPFKGKISVNVAKYRANAVIELSNQRLVNALDTLIDHYIQTNISDGDEYDIDYLVLEIRDQLDEVKKMRKLRR